MSNDHADDALGHAVITMRPGWIALRGCTLDAGGDAPVRVRYALLHPKVGIALLDVVPGRTAPHAPDRLRRTLGAGKFHAEFGCIPPILYLCIPLRALSDVGHLLEHEFSRQPASALPRGDAWVTAAQAALSAQPLKPVQPSAGRAGQRLSHALQGWQPPARRPGGARLLVAFWGLALSTAGGGALFLQYLGPPERAVQAAAPLITQAAASFEPPGADRTPFPAADASGLAVADLRRTLIENDHAIAELQSRLGRLRPEVAATVAGAALTSIALSDAVAEGAAGMVPQRRELADTNAQMGRAGQPVTAAEQLAAVQRRSGDAQTPDAGMSRQFMDAADAETRLTARRPVGQAIARHGEAALPALDDGQGVVPTSAATAPAASRDGAAFKLAPFAAALSPPGRPPDPAYAALAETMVRRGDALFQHGDVSAARLLYDRAASAGSAHAATAMGKTFDPTVLAGIGAVGLSPDPALAALWYRRGLSLGDEEARTRLRILPPMASRAARAELP